MGARRKFQYSGSHSIGHSKQKKLRMYMIPIPNRFRDRAISPYNFRIFNKKKIF
jgi:hypothetical protein